MDEMGALVIAEHVRADHAFELGEKWGKKFERQSSTQSKNTIS